MPEGVITEVVDGYATIDFVDPTLKGSGLNRLLRAAENPRDVEQLTREGPRRKYRVPEDVAAAAGLLDSPGDVVRFDQGVSQALADAHDAARAAPSRPDAPTSRNVAVGETTFTEARQSTGHVASTVDGTTGYPSGTAAALPHAEVITQVAAAQGKAPVLEGQAPSFEVLGAPVGQDYPLGEAPSEDWSRKQIDAYAKTKGVDTTKAPNKPEALSLINPQ